MLPTPLKVYTRSPIESGVHVLTFAVPPRPISDGVILSRLACVSRQAIEMIGAKRSVPQAVRFELIDVLERYQLGEYAMIRCVGRADRSSRNGSNNSVSNAVMLFLNIYLYRPRSVGCLPFEICGIGPPCASTTLSAILGLLTRKQCTCCCVCADLVCTGVPA